MPPLLEKRVAIAVPYVKAIVLGSGAIALLLLVRLLAPVPHFGFVSDDYLLLVEDANLPWFDSSDHLYRVLRNGLCRLMPRLFGMQPEPYHLFEIAAYLFSLALLAVFLRKEGAGIVGTVGGVTLVALYPRNHPELFGFVWVQETGAALGILAGLILWGIFRQRGSRMAYLLALLSFALGIGFKETGIVFPAVVFAVDLFRYRFDLAAMRSRKFYLPYTGVFLVLILFAGFVFSQAHGRIVVPDPQGTYRTHSLSGTALGMARAVMNLALPFSLPFGLRDMKPVDYAGAALILLALLLTARWTSTLGHWMVSIVWVLAAIFPPSMFARANNADQYLFLPIIGVAFAMSATLDSIAAARRSWMVIGIVVAVILYAVAGSRQLAEARQEWESAGRTVQEFLNQIRSVSPPAQTGSLIIVNSPHSIGRAPVLGSGLRGALIAAGYRRDLQGTFRPSATFENELVDAMVACPASSIFSRQPILVWREGSLSNLTGDCAQRLIASDQTQHSWRWFPIYSSESAP